MYSKPSFETTFSSKFPKIPKQKQDMQNATKHNLDSKMILKQKIENRRGKKKNMSCKEGLNTKETQ